MTTSTNKKLIFTVTTGRSGTDLLHYLLKKNKRLTVFHEPDEGAGFQSYMRDLQNDPMLGKAFWMEKKLPFINRQRGNVYIETSHLFCKGFLEPLLELGITPDLIILKRNARDVAKSLLQLGTIPMKSKSGEKYLLSPIDPSVNTPFGYEKYSDYQLCYWYCLEIERRQLLYRNMILSIGGQVIEVNFEDLIKITPVIRILKKLNLPNYSLEEVYKILRFKLEKKKINNKEKKKKKIPNIDYTEEEKIVLTHFF